MHQATTGLMFDVWNKTHLPYPNSNKTNEDFTPKTQPWAI